MTRLQRAIRRELADVADEAFVGYEQELLRQAPHESEAPRGDYDRGRDLDALHERRNRLRMWSYKGVGLRP